MTIITGLAFAVSLGAFLWDDYYGFLFLLCGFFLANRSFAYIYLPLGSFPLFITEFSLLLWTTRTIYRLMSRPGAVTPLLPKALRWWLGLFVAIGLVSLIRGLLLYPFIHVFRDFALVYYSITIILISRTPLTRERIDQMLRLGAIVIFVHALRAIAPFIFPSFLLRVTSVGQGAGSSLCLSIALLSMLAIQQLTLSNVYHAFWAIVLFAAVLSELVRTAWTGLAAGIFVILVSVLQTTPHRQPILNTLKTLAIVIGGAFLLLWSPSAISAWNSARARTTAVSHETPSVFVSPPVPIPVSSSAPMAEPSLVKPQVTPLEKKEAPLPAVLEELDTFKDIANTNNGVTRLRMWHDAMEELFSIGLFSNHLHRADLQRYALSQFHKKSQKEFIVIKPAGLGLESEKVILKITDAGAAHAATAGEEFTRLTKILFGFPFGKYFLPPQVIWWLNSPHRYDPHNSWVAITYRMGFLGLFVFIGLLFVVSRSILGRLDRTRFADPWIHSRLLMIAACIGYMLVHMLTDNTLENSFKGIFLWLLIGLAFNPVMGRDQD